jgi:predicted aspartyl protease
VCAKPPSDLNQTEESAGSAVLVAGVFVSVMLFASGPGLGQQNNRPDLPGPSAGPGVQDMPGRDARTPATKGSLERVLPTTSTELSCLPANILIGNDNPAPGNRVISTYVRHSRGGWLIYHTLESNTIVDRSRQYSISDTSTPIMPHQWTGTYKNNPNWTMIGEIRNDPKTGHYFYFESIYDRARNGALIVKTLAECSRIEPGVTPLVKGSAPSFGGQRESRTVVPLVQQGGTFLVPVTINGQLTLDFVVDSGAADVSMPADVVMTLIRTGTITDDDFLGKETYRLADGSTVPSQQFIIRSLKVGDETLTNVTGSVASVAGSLILGQSFLSRFRFWSMDNQKAALILN